MSDVTKQNYKTRRNMGSGDLKKIIGILPNESEYKKRIRFHQGWWRAFVLNEPIGLNPAKRDESVCNTILLGEQTKSNFLTNGAVDSIRDTQQERQDFEAGLFNEDRLFNNLLSSQPLTFNFFGDLKQDLNLATRICKQLFPSISSVTNVLFEYAPRNKYTNDNSAFDVALEVTIEGKKGLIGLECKYTDTFSTKAYDKSSYREIYAKSTNFLQPYEAYTVSRFNQLFRNQLIAESLVQNSEYNFFYTGLFCFEGDGSAIQTGAEFQKMLNGGQNTFKVIRYKDFISAVQTLDLTWEQREWTMMLWARYCALNLTKAAYEDKA
jgi:hypothetical protein